MNITYVIGTFGHGAGGGYIGAVTRFFLAGFVFSSVSSCVDGSAGFYVEQGDWASDSASIDFNGVLWGTNAFESVQLQNTGPQEVVLELSWKEDSSRAFRVMQDFLAVPAQSTARLDVVFYSTSADLEFSAEVGR